MNKVHRKVFPILRKHLCTSWPIGRERGEFGNAFRAEALLLLLYDAPTELNGTLWRSEYAKRFVKPIFCDLVGRLFLCEIPKRRKKEVVVTRTIDRWMLTANVASAIPYYLLSL